MFLREINTNIVGNMKPIISIVVPIHNKVRYLERTLSSFYHYRIPNKTEIILVDDGSTDGSTEIARNFELTYPDVFFYIKVQNCIDHSPSRARNIGTRLANGKYITYLDADDLILPGYLEKAVSYMETHDCDYFRCADLRISDKLFDGLIITPDEVLLNNINICNQVGNFQIFDMHYYLLPEFIPEYEIPYFIFGSVDDENGYSMLTYDCKGIYITEYVKEMEDLLGLFDTLHVEDIHFTYKYALLHRKIHMDMDISMAGPIYIMDSQDSFGKYDHDMVMVEDNKPWWEVYIFQIQNVLTKVGGYVRPSEDNPGCIEYYLPNSDIIKQHLMDSKSQESETSGACLYNQHMNATVC